MKPTLVLVLHEKGAHRYQSHPLCPACRHEDPVIEAGWLRRVAERRLPTRIEGGSRA